MPNPENVCRPVLLIGAGRTASSYVQDRLCWAQCEFDQVIENDVYRDVYVALTNPTLVRPNRPDWPRDLHYVADEAEIERRTLESVRTVLMTMFPGERPHWVMKLIWQDHDPDMVDKIFPQSRFIHLVRDPRTNLASMIEYLGHTRKYAEGLWVDSNVNALQFRERFPDRYLKVEQERFVDDRAGAWRDICDFCGVGYPGDDVWERELNTSESTKGKVGQKRSDNQLKWRSLPRAVQDVATTLGYRAD